MLALQQGTNVVAYLAESFCLSVLLKTECREVDTRAENLGFRKNANTTNTINFHLHVWVTVGVAEVGQMRAPSGVLCVTFYNDCILVESVGEGEGSLRFLPGVQVVWLFAAKPVRKWSPDI